MPVTGDFVGALRTLAPLMSDDASRPWACGVMVQSKSAYATNNVIVAEYWHGLEFPCRITIPAQAVNEILKVKEEVTHVQMDEGSITVWFGPDKWLRTIVLEDAFPDRLPAVMDSPGQPPVALSNYPGFFDALRKLDKFTAQDNRVIFLDGAFTTSKDDGTGATVEVPGLVAGPCFQQKYLSLIESVATHVDFTPYPKPCRFFGGRLRGIIAGMMA